MTDREVLRARVDELAAREAQMRLARFAGSPWHVATAEHLRSLRLVAELELERMQSRGGTADAPSLF